MMDTTRFARVICPSSDVAFSREEPNIVARVAGQKDEFQWGCGNPYQQVDVSWEMTWGVHDVDCSIVEEINGVFERGDGGTCPGEDKRGVEGCFRSGWEWSCGAKR